MKITSTITAYLVSALPICYFLQQRVHSGHSAPHYLDYSVAILDRTSLSAIINFELRLAGQKTLQSVALIIISQEDFLSLSIGGDFERVNGYFRT